mmetsp:Transcript_22723/g.38081  ORF Transcript_22723/g.38081 Transcript_22723/m.38081 type:complete len:152 (-) Transcript_22723:1211-1666(-)
MHIHTYTLTLASQRDYYLCAYGSPPSPQKALHSLCTLLMLYCVYGSLSLGCSPKKRRVSQGFPLKELRVSRCFTTSAKEGHDNKGADKMSAPFFGHFQDNTEKPNQMYGTGPMPFVPHHSFLKKDMGTEKDVTTHNATPCHTYDTSINHCV